MLIASSTAGTKHRTPHQSPGANKPSAQLHVACTTNNPKNRTGDTGSPTYTLGRNRTPNHAPRSRHASSFKRLGAKHITPTMLDTISLRPRLPPTHRQARRAPRISYLAGSPHTAVHGLTQPLHHSDIIAQCFWKEHPPAAPASFAWAHGRSNHSLVASLH